MRLFAVMLLVLSLVACGMKTDIVMLGPAGSASVSPDSVQFFDGPQRVLIGYEALATISVEASGTGSVAPHLEDVVVALREATVGAGADALILDELLDQERGVPAVGRGTAIQLTPGPEERDLASSPRWLEGIGTVAVVPVLRTDLPLPDSLGAEFDAEVEYGLEAAGFQVVASSLYDSIRLAYILEVDGIFNPVTGERYDDRATYVEQSTRLELMERYLVDGFVVPEIRPVLAWYEGVEGREVEAEWDGVSRTVAEGPDIHWLTELVDALHCDDDEPDCVNEIDEEDRDEYSGSVAALSLMISLENAIGATLYTGSGGVEVLELLDPETGRVYSPRDTPLLSDPERIREAVELALDGLRRPATRR